MKLAITVLAIALAGCATGEVYRTTTTEKGAPVTYEAKRTGLWFATRIEPLKPDASLDLK